MHKTIDQSPHVVNPIITRRPGGVELTPNGIRFTRSSRPEKMKGGGRRGKVEGFSYASARRLREKLFRCDFRPPVMGVVGVCFTLPPESSNSAGEDVWNFMRRHPPEDLVSLVWRKEVQRNGREHWHTVVWSRKPNPLPVVGALIRTWCKLVAKRCPNPEPVERRMLWSHFRGCNGVDYEAFFGPDLPCAAFDQVCASVKAITRIDSQGQGVRYLIDHSSKHKAYQAKTTGRPWGVWGDKRLPRLPDGTSIYARLDHKNEVELARILRRLSRYWVKVPCVFGWKWCRGRRFARGANILPDAMARDAVRLWLERRGIIKDANPPPPRPLRPVQPSLPLMGQDVADFAADVWQDWDKGKPVP